MIIGLILGVVVAGGIEDHDSNTFVILLFMFVGLALCFKGDHANGMFTDERRDPSCRSREDISNSNYTKRDDGALQQSRGGGGNQDHIFEAELTLNINQHFCI